MTLHFFWHCDFHAFEAHFFSNSPVHVPVLMSSWNDSMTRYLFDCRRQKIYGRRYKNVKDSTSGVQTLKKNTKIERVISIIRKHTWISNAKALSKKMHIISDGLLLINQELVPLFSTSALGYEARGHQKGFWPSMGQRGNGISIFSFEFCLCCAFEGVGNWWRWNFILFCNRMWFACPIKMFWALICIPGHSCMWFFQCLFHLIWLLRTC